MAAMARSKSECTTPQSAGLLKGPRKAEEASRAALMRYQLNDDRAAKQQEIPNGLKQLKKQTDRVDPFIRKKPKWHFKTI